MRMARVGAHSGLKARAFLREEHDDRRAEQEAAHFLALPEHDILLVVTPFADHARTRRIDHAVPDGGHATDDGGADQGQHEGAVGRVEDATTRSLRANRPGTPRAVVGLTENSAPGASESCA